LEELPDARQLLLIESGARVSDVLQRASLVDAEEQRAEVLARLSRLGPAADDELLLPHELQLAPRRAPSSALIRRARLLDDEALPAFRQRALVKRMPVAGGLLAETKNRGDGMRDTFLEARAAVRQ